MTIGLWVLLCHFQQYFSYTVAVPFIVEETEYLEKTTRYMPYHKSLTNFATYSGVEYTRLQLGTKLTNLSGDNIGIDVNLLRS